MRAISYFIKDYTKKWDRNGRSKRQHQLCFSLLTGFLMQVSAISGRELLDLSEGQITHSLCQNTARVTCIMCWMHKFLRR